LDIPISVNLNRGWNGISAAPIDGLEKRREISLEAEFEDIGLNRLYDTIQLSKDLQAQGIKATRVAFWNTSSQRWDIEELPIESNPGPGIGVSVRIIMPDDGFFLLCEENDLFINNLDLKQDPPAPPKPPVPPLPDKVSYLGKVQEDIGPWLGGERPPYAYFMMVPCGPMLPAERQLPLKGVNQEIEDQLADAAADGQPHYKVTGTMKLMDWPSVERPTIQVDVLMVESVEIVLPTL
jgi:hypothetical protein